MDYLDKARRVIALEADELHRLYDRLDGPDAEQAALLVRFREDEKAEAPHH